MTNEDIRRLLGAVVVVPIAVVCTGLGLWVAAYIAYFVLVWALLAPYTLATTVGVAAALTVGIYRLATTAPQRPEPGYEPPDPGAI